MTKIDVLLGLQWGDEGKGKIVDVLTPRYDVVARFQGGPNAGHTLEFNGLKHVLHIIPSGIFHKDKINLIGNGVLIEPRIFRQEIEGIADGWQTVASRKLDVKDAYQLNVTVDMSADCDILLSNAHGEEYGLHVDSQRRDIVINRGAKTGLTDFSGNFPITSMRSSLFTDHQQVTLCIYVDQSNVEVTTDDGSVIMSTLVFPQSLYDQVVISGQKAKAQVRNLRRVWE
jgi:hypothetical protein